MTLIRRPTPFGELVSLRQAMDRFFDDSLFKPAGWTVSPRLAVDISSSPDAVVIEAALPGVKPEDVNVSVLDDALTISANTSEDRRETDEGYTYREIRRGSFSRTVTLPKNVKSDEATATFENGLLRLSFPKAEEAKPRQIQISGVSEGHAAEATEQPQVEQGS
jgi:HSP20 family protein